MFLPFDTSISMWLTAIPHYEWVPVLPPDSTPACGPDTTGAMEEGGAPVPQQYHLVLKDFEWVTYRLWGAVANPAWELVAENRRDQDEERIDDQKRQANRTPHVPPAPVVTPAGETGGPAAPADPAA